MVTPTQRRDVVAWARRGYLVSERRACRAVAVPRSLVRYRSRRGHQAPLRRRLRELAAVRVYAGYRRLYDDLRREGWPVNHKRVYRLYTEEGLTLRRRRPKRRRSATVRVGRPAASGPDQQWAMDFMHDTLADGTAIRVLTAIDVHSRECVALRPAKSFTGAQLAEILTEAGRSRKKLPDRICLDNGTEFTSRALDAWAYWNRVQLDFSRPGRPGDNAFIESFNATVRRECLSQHWFRDLDEAASLLRSWREEYNNRRPHTSLGRLSPARYRAGEFVNHDRNEPEHSQPQWT